MHVKDIRFLYGYNRWANARVVAAASALTPAQLFQDLRSSHRSVHGTLAHILWGEWLWLGRCQEPPGPPGPDPLEIEDLSAFWARWETLALDQAAFLARLTDSSLARRITYENPPGTPWTYFLGRMMQHVVNHSTYHRGQVTAMLRQLGAPARQTDLLVFIDEQPALEPGP